jgi:protein NrfD
MSLSTVLFFFLAHLGVGIAFTLLFVHRDAGVKFFRFNGGLAAVLLGIALAFRYQAVLMPPIEEPSGIGAVSVGASLSDIALVVSAAITLFYWATIGRVFTRARTAILAAAAIAGLAAIALQALEISSGSSSAVVALTVLSFLTSALMLGGACTAMILGHWYLVIPSMEVSYLQSIVKGHIASMLGRMVVVGAAVWFAMATWQVDSGLPSFRHYIMSVDGIFFWQRVLFGLAGPAVLSYLTWETAKIRSTQSATGILYVDFFTVVVGEVLAKYIVLATHVPV